MATSVYYAHGSGGDRHNDTIVTLPHTPRPRLPCDLWGRWHISGTDSAHGKNLTRSFLITATLLSACRMWCHHTDGFFGNTSVLMAVISYVLTQLCFIQSVTFQHRINISGTTSTHTSSVVNSSCLSVCLQAPSTWSTSCLMTMCFTCWSPCTARREPTTSWGPWRETAAQVRPLPSSGNHVELIV